MKKVLVYALSVCLAVCGFTSCASLPHDHIVGEWKYTQENHWRPITCEWNVCDFNIAPEAHVDEDENGVCDVCGYTQTTDVCTFETLYGLSDHIDISLLKSVTLDYANASLATPVLHSVFITADQDYLNAVRTFIANATFTPATDVYYGVGVYKVTLVTGIKDFTFYFTNRNEFFVNGQCYNASQVMPLAAKFDREYQYLESQNVQYSSYTSVTTLDDFDISAIHFKKTSFDDSILDFTKDADLWIDGTRMQLIYKRLMCWEGTWYEVVSEQDFSELLPKEERTCEFVFASANGTILARVMVSKNVIYTVSEMWEMIKSFTDNLPCEMIDKNGSAFSDRAFLGDEVITLLWDSED